MNVLTDHNYPEHDAKTDLSDGDCPVIVRTGPCPSSSTARVWCYHRSFPTALGLGDTPRDAALDLIQRLKNQKDTVSDRWHVEKVESAIAEIGAFLDGVPTELT